MVSYDYNYDSDSVATENKLLGSCQQPKKLSVLQVFVIFLVQFGINKHF